MFQKFLKKILIGGLVVIVFFAANSASLTNLAWAAKTTPDIIVYDGILKNAGGVPITTAQTFRFSFWLDGDFTAGVDRDGAGAIPGGAPGFAGFSEVQTTTPEATGFFQFNIGAVAGTLPDFAITSELFLQVEVKPSGDPDTSYETLDNDGVDNADDRQAIGTLPYSRNADMIDNADLGTGVGNIVPLGAGSVFPISTIPGGTDAATFTLDNDNAGAGANVDIVANQGADADGTLRYNAATDQWEISNNGGAFTAIATGTDADTLDTLDSLQFLRSDAADNFTAGTLTTDAGTTFDVNGVIDASGATRFAMRLSAADPATCTVGDLYFNTTDNLLRGCTAVNTWSVVRDGGNADTLDTLDSGDLLRSNAADNYTAGTLTFDAGSTLVTDGTLDVNGVATIGDGGDNVTIDSSVWDISSAGVASGFTGITSTGGIDFSAATSINIPHTTSATFTLDNDNAGAGVNVDIVANQGSDADGTLRYNATSNQWEISNNGGGFTAIATGTDADTLDTLDSLQFLRSDASDNFTAGTLTTDAGSTFDINGIIDANGATRFAMRLSAADPATCTIGDLYFNTTDNLLRGCTAVNTWSVVRDGGNADTVDSLEGSDLLRSNAADNYTAGTLTFDAGTTLVTDGTLDVNGVATIGDNGDNVTIDSSVWDISSAGVASGFTGITSTGGIDFSAATSINIPHTTSATFTLDNDNAGAGVNVDIVANQGSDADGTLRYNATANQWEISNNGGGFVAISTGTDADTLDTLDSLQFLRSDASDNFTAGTLTTDAGSTFDVNGVIDANGATRFAMRLSAADPATCTIGDLYFNTTDNLLRGCTAVNTWSVVRDGGNADTVDSLEGSDLLRSNASDNFTTGTLTTDAGTTLDVDGVFDGSGATRFAIRSGAGDPATCTIGDQFYNTTGSQLKMCTAVNTWTAVDTDTTSVETLDTAYNAGQSVTVDASGDLVFNLANTEDFVIQDGGTPFATFTDGGDLNLTNNLTVGAAAETIGSDGGFFNLDGDDLFVAGELGVEAGIATDDTQTKYLEVDLEGCKRTNLTRGNKISGNVPTIRFDPDADGQLRCTFPVPDDWQSGDITLTLFWSPSATEAAVNVDWEVTSGSAGAGDTLNAGVFSTTSVQEAPGTVNVIQTESFTVTGVAANEMVMFRIRRDADDAVNDTYTGFVDLTSLRIEYTGKKLR